MQNERDDVWKTSFYDRAIRAKIGAALSKSYNSFPTGYAPS